MGLVKTEKARAELRPGGRSLGQRQRCLLLLADGFKTAPEVAAFFGHEGERLVQQLVHDGYLTPRTAAAPGTPFPPAATAVVDASPTLALVPAYMPASVPTAIEPPVPVAAAPVAADAFDGKRSLATTRMYLFDLCERMFARRDPVQAENFRVALREARDRVSMLEVGRAMLDEIERSAGAERADSIRERIALLLPPELVS